MPQELPARFGQLLLSSGKADTQARLDAIVKDWHRSGFLIEAEKRHHISPASPALVELHKQFEG